MIVFRTLYLYKTHIELFAFYRHYSPVIILFELFDVLFISSIVFLIVLLSLFLRISLKLKVLTGKILSGKTFKSETFFGSLGLSGPFLFTGSVGPAGKSPSLP